MKKIPTLFRRDFSGPQRTILNEVTPGCEWVLAGEGVATRKFDGTCCLVKDGMLYKRYDAKKGKVPPAGFIPAQESPDPTTGHWPGWQPVGAGPEDAYHREAWDQPEKHLDGTYELIGPKIQGNPEGAQEHRLVRHGEEVWAFFPRTFEAIREVMKTLPHEGVVWHHPDGRMCKLKKKDFEAS